MAKKKDKFESKVDNSLIQTLTVSLFIILLAFFILLNSIAVVDEKKKRKVVGSIVESFGGESLIEPATGDFSENVFTNGVSPVEFLGLVAGVDEKLKDIKITNTRKTTTLSLPEDMFFSRYGTRLKKSNHVFLKKLSKVIRKNKFPVNISCHLDDSPIFEKTGITSRELTVIRSIRLLRYFIEAGKISPKLLTAYGWGMEKPMEINKTSETRKMNRRVDITFMHDQSKSRKKGFFIFKDFFFHVDD